MWSLNVYVGDTFYTLCIRRPHLLGRDFFFKYKRSPITVTYTVLNRFYLYFFLGSDTSSLTVISDNLPMDTWIKICVRIKGDSLNGLTCNELFCGSPPSNGICSISTSNGVALETNFTINCTGYIDDGIKAFRAFANPRPSYAGILYVVLFVSDENMVVIYYGGKRINCFICDQTLILKHSFYIDSSSMYHGPSKDWQSWLSKMSWLFFSPQ